MAQPPSPVPESPPASPQQIKLGDVVDDVPPEPSSPNIIHATTLPAPGTVQGWLTVEPKIDLGAKPATSPKSSARRSWDRCWFCLEDDSATLAWYDVGPDATETVTAATAAAEDAGEALDVPAGEAAGPHGTVPHAFRWTVRGDGDVAPLTCASPTAAERQRFLDALAGGGTAEGFVAVAGRGPGGGVALRFAVALAKGELRAYAKERLNAIPTASMVVTQSSTSYMATVSGEASNISGDVSDYSCRFVVASSRVRQQVAAADKETEEWWRSQLTLVHNVTRKREKRTRAAAPRGRDALEDNLFHLLAHRPSKDEVVERNIMPDTDVSAPRLVAAKKALEKEKAEQGLERMIAARASREELVRKNIMKTGTGSLQGSAQSLLQAKMKQNLRAKLEARPDAADLEKFGVSAPAGGVPNAD